MPDERSTQARRVLPARAGLISRLWRTAARQVSEIEARLKASTGDAVSLERDAKTLAVLARTVRDLVALDQETARGQAEAAHDEPDFPRDLDAFRVELAQKLAELGALEGGD